jgi:hypothetical protein
MSHERWRLLTSGDPDYPPAPPFPSTRGASSREKDNAGRFLSASGPNVGIGGLARPSSSSGSAPLHISYREPHRILYPPDSWAPVRGSSYRPRGRADRWTPYYDTVARRDPLRLSPQPADDTMLDTQVREGERGNYDEDSVRRGTSLLDQLFAVPTESLRPRKRRRYSPQSSNLGQDDAGQRAVTEIAALSAHQPLPSIEHGKEAFFSLVIPRPTPTLL